MTRPVRMLVRRTLVGTLVAALVAALTALTVSVTGGAARAENGSKIVTPGNFTGYGFDQCLAPSQSQMNTWLQSSPFLAVGIYMAGDSRGCLNQPNLTPAWVSTQLSKGWRLLPITLGPQASCQPRFPRYGNDETINPKPGAAGRYYLARRQGTAEASKSVDKASSLGISAGSTLWYDIEGFDSTNTNCRESAKAFLGAWTERLHALDYRSGVYSSVSSGIKMLDDERAARSSGGPTLPDQIWLARWDGVANTSSSYISETGWRPHARIKQYQGGHRETWGGVTIDIDRDFLDLGRGSVAPGESHCSGTRVNFKSYAYLRPPGAGVASAPGLVKALQCLLKEKGSYRGEVNGNYNGRLTTAVRSWQQGHGFGVSDRWSHQNWMSLLAGSHWPVVKQGSGSMAVRRLQRALNAASSKAQVPVTGVFTTSTGEALRAWQDKAGLPVNGVGGYRSWVALAKGTR